MPIKLFFAAPCHRRAVGWTAGRLVPPAPPAPAKTPPGPGPHYRFGRPQAPWQRCAPSHRTDLCRSDRSGRRGSPCSKLRRSTDDPPHVDALGGAIGAAWPITSTTSGRSPLEGSTGGRVSTGQAGHRRPPAQLWRPARGQVARHPVDVGQSGGRQRGLHHRAHSAMPATIVYGNRAILAGRVVGGGKIVHHEDFEVHPAVRGVRRLAMSLVRARDVGDRVLSM